MKATKAEVIQAIIDHYLEHGSGIWSVDLAAKFEVTRPYIETYLESCHVVQSIKMHNPVTAPKRERKSKRFYPTIESLRQHILRTTKP